jgi:hypothetical protein
LTNQFVLIFATPLFVRIRSFALGERAVRPALAYQFANPPGPIRLIVGL